MPLLRHQASVNKTLAMMRKGGGRDVELFLHFPHGHALRPRTHQNAINLQAGRIAKSFELSSGLFMIHHGGKVRDG